MKIWKKSLLVTGVLAMVLAGSAFAATVAEDAEIQREGLEYNKRVEQEAPEYYDQAEQERPYMRRFRHRFGPRHHGFRHHGPWGGPGPHHGGFRGPHGDRENRPGRLTQEQRYQLAKEREEYFANWQNMSDRERHEATEKFINRVNEERMKNMTDAEKEVFEKRQAERKAEREKIANMTEDERHAYFKEKHDQMVKKRTEHMTKEERERFLERDKRHQERMEAFREKWKQMTPEEKEQWKKDRHRFGPRHHGFRHHGPRHHGPWGGPGPHHGGFRGPHGDRENRPGRLTQEQRYQLSKEREEFFANWQNMSDRERREATERFIHRVNEERMKNMNDAEKKVFEKRQAERKAEREKIANMTEDERHAYFKKKHDQMVKERIKHMTKEERERFLARDKRHQERLNAFWEKWKKMTPEEKEQWKKDHPRFGPRRGGPRPGRRLFSPGGAPRNAG